MDCEKPIPIEDQKKIQEKRGKEKREDQTP
jgi:hypothetical protein